MGFVGCSQLRIKTSLFQNADSLNVKVQAPGARAKRQRMSQEGEGLEGTFEFESKFVQVDILTAEEPGTSVPPSRCRLAHPLDPW